MDEVVKKQVSELILKAQGITVFVSTKSGFDGLASGLALYQSLKKIGKNMSIVAPTPTVGDAQSLYSVGKINKNDNQKDLIINIPNAIQNVDKVSYTIKNDQLNIKIHSLAGSEGITQEGITLSRTSTSSGLSILIGFDSDEQLEQDITHEQINSADSLKISINNTEMKLNSVQVCINNTQASCLSELVTSSLIQLALPIDEDTAFNLYSGIKNATNMFSPIDVKSNTLEIAQNLIKLGAPKASLAARKSPISPLEPKTTIQPEPFSDTPIDPQQTDLTALSKKISATFSTKNKNVESSKIEPKSKSISAPIYEDTANTPLEKVESKEGGKQSWLKPPKIYRGSKSFDRES